MVVRAHWDQAGPLVASLDPEFQHTPECVRYLSQDSRRREERGESQWQNLTIEISYA